jgi:hypothetical protein
LGVRRREHCTPPEDAPAFGGAAARTLYAARGRPSIWGCGGENIVRRQRTPKPLECELTHRLNRYGIFNCHENARTDQDLTGLSLVAKTRGDIGNRPDSGIIEASFEADSAERGMPVRYADTKADLVAQPPPLGRASPRSPASRPLRILGSIVLPRNRLGQPVGLRP